jgi:branched-chain amino acid transport system permease protein
MTADRAQSPSELSTAKTGPGGSIRWILSWTPIALAILVCAGVFALTGGVEVAALAGLVASLLASAALRSGVRVAVLGCLGVGILALPFYYSAFNLTQIVVLAIGTWGLVMLGGQTGQISVAQGPFVGVGAYTTAVLSVQLGVPWLLTIPAGVIAGALIGLIIGIPSSRLRGIYQVITTLAVAVSFPTLLLAIGDPVGGSTGIALRDPFKAMHVGTTTVDSTQLMYFFSILCAALVWLVLSRIINSRHGTAMRAVRQNETVAAVNGISVSRYRVISFVLSAACAGLAGTLSALSVGAVSPESFGMLYSIAFLVALAVGGSEALMGGLLGAVAIFYLTTGFAGIPVAGFNVSNEVVYGLVVILSLLFLPGGIWGAITSLAGKRNATAPV